MLKITKIALGALISFMSLNAQSMIYKYDKINRLTDVIYANGNTIKYEYDPAGNIVSVLTTSSVVDTDSDGILDSIDNCISISNANQLNTDSDSQGNACDLDDDNDGIYDVWEIKYGLNSLFSGDALLDLDKDGVTNLAEYQANTNPKVNEPAVAVQSILNFMNKPKKKKLGMPAYLIPTAQ